jgi:dTDP-4-dehydrorhamnose 3,5-epimerase
MDQVTAVSEPLLTPLRRIEHEKGDLYHGMKAGDPGFAGFGEAYFTTVLIGQIKGWKKHHEMVLNLVVPVGEICFYVHDESIGKTTAYKLGPENYARLTVPAGYWVAFEGRGIGVNLACNLASIVHRADEAVSVDLSSFPLDFPV